MSANKEWSTSEVKQLTGMADSGMTLDEAAKELGRTKNSVAYGASANDVKFRWKSITKLKRFTSYGSMTQRVLMRMYAKHPEPIKVQMKNEGLYEALERDGWVKPIGKRSAILTDKGAAKMAEISRQA